jgi:hypothetical protein
MDKLLFWILDEVTLAKMGRSDIAPNGGFSSPRLGGKILAV